MSAKRPRPAIPVLVHVDNPTEAGSVTVDTSTIEGKMDTVIANQNRIYDKIPTSSGGGGSADLTTVNEKTTALAATIGPVDSDLASNNLFGTVKNLSASIGDFNSTPSDTDTSVRSFLYSLRRAIGLAGSSSSDHNIFGYVRNLHYAVGDTASIPTTSDTSVRGLLTAIKQNTASGGSGGKTDLTTVNENTTTMKNTIGTLNSSSKDTDLIGCVRNLRVSIGASGNQLLPSGDSIRSFLLNLCKAVGNSYDTPTATETTVRGLLTAIKENTASGGSGGSADLTTVNEKTTALAAAIGSASDDSSTVSVIGLLKSITDKY